MRRGLLKSARVLTALLLAPVPAVAQQVCTAQVANGVCIVAGFYPAPVGSQGSFRTVCVRPADGFFFPISFDARQSQLAADEAICMSRCQGGVLYYYPNPGGSIEDAVNRRGESYRNSPNAFAYRTAYYPKAACETHSTTGPNQSLKPATDPLTGDRTTLETTLILGPVRIVGPTYNVIAN